MSIGILDDNLVESGESFTVNITQTLEETSGNTLIIIDNLDGMLQLSLQRMQSVLLISYALLYAL